MVILDGEPLEGALVLVMAQEYCIIHDGWDDIDPWDGMEDELSKAELELLALEEELFAQEDSLMVQMDELLMMEIKLMEKEARLTEAGDEDGLEALEEEWVKLDAECFFFYL